MSKTKHLEKIEQDYGRVTARILASSARAFEAFTPDTDLATINGKHSLVQLKSEEIFTFDFELSNDRVDSYATRMTPQSLQNFATSINTFGIPLQQNHESYASPTGRIFRGEVVEKGGNQSLFCRAYIVRNDENGGDGISANGMIRKIEAGVQKDVSAGFIARGYTCSVCGCEMAAFWGQVVPDMCGHYPGEEYDGVMAYAWIENAELLEGSLVYHGATPDAMIQKVNEGFARGKLTTQTAQRIMTRLHSEDKLITSEESMNGKELLTRLHGKATGRMAEVLQKRVDEIKEDAPLEDGVKAAEEAVGEVSAENEALMADKVKAEENAASDELKADAELGKGERVKAVEEAITQGTRALGEAFKVEEMRSHLSAATIDYVRTVSEQYRSIADSKVGEGKKADENEHGTTAEERSATGEERVDSADYQIKK